MKGEKMRKNGCRMRKMAEKAKTRLKNGFWEDYRENVETTVKAKPANSCRSEIVCYYRAKAVREIVSPSDDTFYYKVKHILDTDGDVSDIIGRLCDEDKMRDMSFQEKQMYLFELSEKYRACRERYEQEKRFEIVKADETKIV